MRAGTSRDRRARPSYAGTSPLRSRARAGCAGTSPLHSRARAGYAGTSPRHSRARAGYAGTSPLHSRARAEYADTNARYARARRAYTDAKELHARVRAVHSAAIDSHAEAIPTDHSRRCDGRARLVGGPRRFPLAGSRRGLDVANLGRDADEHFGITGNSEAISTFGRQVVAISRKSLARRSNNFDDDV